MSWICKEDLSNFIQCPTSPHKFGPNVEYSLPNVSKALAVSQDSSLIACAADKRVTVFKCDWKGNSDHEATVSFDCGSTVLCLCLGSQRLDDRSDWLKRGTSRNRLHKFEHLKDTLLAVGLQNGRIEVRSANTGQFHLQLADHRAAVLDLSFAQNGVLLLLSVSRDGTFKLWDFYDDGNRFKSVTSGSCHFGTCCAWSPTNKLFAVGATDKSLCLWSTESWSLAGRLNGHLHRLSCCTFSCDGALVISGAWDASVIVWNTYDMRMLRKLWHMSPPPRPIFASGENDHYVRALCLSPDSSLLCTVCDDGCVRIWPISDHSAATVTELHIPDCCTCRFVPGAAKLIIGTKLGRLYTCDVNVSLFTSLSRLCRNVIRLWCEDESKVQSLPLPQKIKKLLCYADVTK